MMKTEYTKKGDFLQREGVGHEVYTEVYIKVRKLKKETVRTCLKRFLKGKPE